MSEEPGREILFDEEVLAEEEDLEGAEALFDEVCPACGGPMVGLSSEPCHEWMCAHCGYEDGVE